MADKSDSIPGEGSPNVAVDGYAARSSGLWAKKKLRILNKYMDLFTVGMKNKWEGLIYVDLFAGPGRCIVPESRDEFDGSPLLAMKAKNPFKQLYFIEQQTANIAALKFRTEKDARVKILPMNCNLAVDEIIAKKRSNTLYLIFVDPTGLDIHFDTLRKLSNALPCDFLINWFMSAIVRNLKQWSEIGESARLDKFFGTSDWKKSLNAGSNRLVFNSLRGLYSSQLSLIGYKHQGVPYSLKNSIDAELYWLWFASRHERGLDFWQKCVKSADEQMEFGF